MADNRISIARTAKNNLKALLAAVMTMLVGLITTAMPVAAADSTNDKVLVVLVYDNHCKVWCGKVVPLLRELGTELQDKITLLEIDNSADKAEQAVKMAKDNGILGDYKDLEAVPVVMIFNKTRKLAKQIDGPKDKTVYKAAIEKVLK